MAQGKTAQRLGAYLDESATDDGSQIAVFAGLNLNWNGYYNLDVEWKRATDAYGLTSIHMRTIGGANGDLAGVSESDRRKLFALLAKIINENKGWSLAATLDTREFKHYFGYLGKRGWSIYSTCFALAVVLHGKQLHREDYPYEVPFLLDDGNRFRQELERAHAGLKNEFQKTYPARLGTLDFGDDAKVRALQAADVIAWTVRRKRTGLPFTNVYEPLEDILVFNHLEQNYESRWMVEIRDAFKQMDAEL